MLKHTKGPWKLVTIGTSVTIYSQANVPIAVMCTSRFTPEMRSTGEYMANVELLGAAPDLLAALEEARNGLIWYHETHPMTINDSDHEAMARIDAAILKATGGAQ